MTQTTTSSQSTPSNRDLYIALDLSRATWQLAVSDGVAKPRDIVVHRDNPDAAKTQFVNEMSAAKLRFGLQNDCAVHAVFEAGRDGFWIERWLLSIGVLCVVIDPASIEVDRKAKQRKTDLIDARKLLQLLIDHLGGRVGLRVVNPPSPEDEDARRPQRLLDSLKETRTRMTTRVQSLLFAQGIDRKHDCWLKDDLATLRTGDGREIGAGLRQELEVLNRLVASLDDEIFQLEQQRAAALAKPTTETQCIAQKLESLVAIGPIGAWTLAHELFGWRHFASGKHLGSFLGLTPTPWATGDTKREQGISKAGPPHLRALFIQLAWAWLRYQPQSPLSLWFNERWAKGGKRSRRVGIVALARKLAVLLWRYVTQGVVPDGVALKADDRRTKPVGRRIVNKTRPRQLVAAKVTAKAPTAV